MEKSECCKDQKTENHLGGGSRVRRGPGDRTKLDPEVTVGRGRAREAEGLPCSNIPVAA